jgi:hypothetical protein
MASTEPSAFAVAACRPACSAGEIGIGPCTGHTLREVRDGTKAGFGGALKQTDGVLSLGAPRIGLELVAEQQCTAADLGNYALHRRAKSK